MIEKEGVPAVGCINGLWLSFLLFAALYILGHILMWIF